MNSPFITALSHLKKSKNSQENNHADAHVG
jgi:hypothetical protein